MTMRYYTDLNPVETDMGRWTVAHVLRGHAAQRPEATYLIAPEEGREFSYAQMLEGAERVAGGMRYKHPWTCSLGYYGMPDKTAEAWRNLWFHTGDALRRDAEGWYYFVDRYKDTLRRRGENISSYEVEQVILAHPAVAECAVIGVPAEVEAGEDEVMAVIVTGTAPDWPGPPAAAVEATAIWEWCQGRMPAFAIPRFVRFTDALPRTPSEKIRKAELRDQGISGASDRLNKS